MRLLTNVVCSRQGGYLPGKVGECQTSPGKVRGKTSHLPAFKLAMALIRYFEWTWRKPTVIFLYNLVCHSAAVLATVQ